MAFSRKEVFTLLPQLVAGMSKPLGHPARVQIIFYLLEHGDTRFRDLVAMLPLSGPTVSQHLRLLRRSKMVDVHEETPHTLYDVNRDQFRKHILVMQEFLRQLERYGIDVSGLDRSGEDEEEVETYEDII